MKMNKEQLYTNQVGETHIKKYSQFFTHYKIADFMCSWACENAKSMLDPAVGNSIFFTSAKKHNNICTLTGYENDHKILDYFGNPESANLIKGDYLLSDWDNKYDAIVCNPPYSKFQSIENRVEIHKQIYKYTGIKCSGYTNLYILFLLKSIFQLSESGRLAYIIPSEFMNSQYGTAIKQILIEKRLLHAVINFENDNEIFFNATTTCCILLLDHSDKSHVTFYNLTTIDELDFIFCEDDKLSTMQIDYSLLSADKKWRSYIKNETEGSYCNLQPISNFCSVSRGIATGANDFFCFSLAKAKENKIPANILSKCICHSSDITTPILDEKFFDSLETSGKTVYILDATSEDYDKIKEYLDTGMSIGVHKKYLTSCRNPWYTMERKTTAPIWVSSACRNNIKFVRNLAQVKSLTTFHSIFIKEKYSNFTDIIFCYFLTPIAQNIIKENRKELGNGLKKFQPNDMNTAKMLDISIISTDDVAKITTIYRKILSDYSYSLVEELNSIFSTYLIK